MPVHKRGDRWHVRLQIGGLKISRSLGAAGTKADAVALEGKIRAEVLAGQLGKSTPHTVDEALTRWLQGEACRLRSYPSLLCQVRAIMPHTAGVALAQITDVVAAVRQAGIHQGLAAATINRRLALLRRVANLAHQQWGWLADDLGKRIKLLPGEKARHVYLTPAEVEHLADCCPHPQVSLAIRLAARTGLREAELLQATTIHDGCIVVGPEISKTARPRLVPVPIDLPGLALPLAITYATLRAHFERARIKAGMPHVRFHDLRHTAASWFAQSGANLAIIRDLLGHSTLAVTSRYAHLKTGDLKQASEAMARAISAESCTESAQKPVSD